MDRNDYDCSNRIDITNVWGAEKRVCQKFPEKSPI